jgi:hypothetical protein
MVKTNTLGALAAAAGALVAVGLLVLMLLMSEAHPAGAILLPGLHGKIAYQGHDGHDWEIYTINPGGGGVSSTSPTTMPTTTSLPTHQQARR